MKINSSLSISFVIYSTDKYETYDKISTGTIIIKKAKSKYVLVKYKSKPDIINAKK